MSVTILLDGAVFHRQVFKMLGFAGNAFGKIFSARSSFRNSALAVICCVAALLVPLRSHAQVEVTFQSGSDLRDLANTYLGDADLWPRILEQNGLNSLEDLRSGTTLVLPVDAVAAARSAIAASLEKIQRANEIGAQIFAYDEIREAIEQHDEALVFEKQGDWTQALDFAVQAGNAANEAYVLAEKNRNLAAEARLSDRQGWVEGKRPEQLGWEDRELNAALIEEEKIRTLSRSTAQITFRDAGRLRLNANSHAVIQQMRVDPLKKKEDAKVTLVEGDFYALLGGNSNRKGLKVDVPEVNAQIESGDFWVRQDDTGAKFTNYDDDKVDIAARGSRISLGRNEGVLVRSGDAPSGIIDLLAAPLLLEPADNGLVYNATADLSWQEVDGASGYWLEVARDPNFNQMVDSATGLTATSFGLDGLEIGLYFWRVVALDQFGLPGTRSLSRQFSMRIDRSPPFLRIETPNSRDIYRKADIRVTGESEPGAVIDLNGNLVPVDDSGRFDMPITLSPGNNILKMTARDSAGNETPSVLEIAHLPDAKVRVIYAEAMVRQSARHFIANADRLTVSGATEPGSTLEIYDAAGALTAEAATAANGQFAFALPVNETHQKFDMKIVTSSGHEATDSFEVSMDLAAPEISLEEQIPRITSVEWLPVRGRILNSDRVLLNGRDIPLAGDRFDEVITLQEGSNTVELSARDQVGNLTVQSWQIILDREPPNMIDHKVSKAGEGRVVVEIRAEDENGLAKAAPFTLEADGGQIKGFLKYNKLSGSFKSYVNVASVENVALKDIELLDDAGNRIRVKIK